MLMMPIRQRMMYIHTRLQSIPFDMAGVSLIHNDQVLFRLVKFFFSGKWLPTAIAAALVVHRFSFAGGTYGLYSFAQIFTEARAVTGNFQPIAARAESAMILGLLKKTGMRLATAMRSTSF